MARWLFAAILFPVVTAGVQASPKPPSWLKGGINLISSLGHPSVSQDLSVRSGEYLGDVLVRCWDLVRTEEDNRAVGDAC